MNKNKIAMCAIIAVAGILILAVLAAISSPTSVRKSGQQDWRINYLSDGGTLFLCAKCDRRIIVLIVALLYYFQ